MKLKIPLNVQVGAIQYAVLRNDFLLHKENKSGTINSLEQKIRIAHRNADQEFLILVHEALHGIADELGYDFDEGCIKAISTGFVLFLYSLGIEPDFSDIPEEGSQGE